jgi:hypothetical protein
MAPANLGKSFEVSKLPHSSAIGSQWMTEKDSKEEKEAYATILKVLSDITTQEMNKKDPLAATINDLDGCAISVGSNAEHPRHSTLQVPEDPAPGTLEGSLAADPAHAAATSKGSCSCSYSCYSYLRRLSCSCSSYLRRISFSCSCYLRRLSCSSSYSCYLKMLSSSSRSSSCSSS